MTDVDFNEIHTMTMGEITEPKKVKTGTWRGRVETGTLKYKNGEDAGPIAKCFFGIKTNGQHSDRRGKLNDRKFRIADWRRRLY